MEILEKVKLIHNAAIDKKALDPVILHVEYLAKITDYFVIYTAGNTIHAQAIANTILEKLEEKGITPLHLEGYRDSLWILIDYGEVVVHVMLREIREYYLLEKLWGDAPRLNL